MRNIQSEKYIEWDVYRVRNEQNAKIMYRVRLRKYGNYVTVVYSVGLA